MAAPREIKIRRRLPAAAISRLRRRRSLRYRAIRRLPGLNRSVSRSALSDAAWRFLARPWGSPLIALAVTVVLAAGNPSLAGARLGCSTIPLVCDEAKSRDFLGLVWQVEGATLALTVAAALFALESAARVRPTTGLADYAGKSRLTHFVMLGVAALLCVGVVLAWTPGLPPPAATAFALGLAMLTIGLFPLFLARMLKVISPEWFRRERLRDIQRAVDEQVRADALALAALSEFEEWSRARQAALALLPRDGHKPIERAVGTGQVYDIDLGRLGELSEVAGNVEVFARVGEQVSEGSVLFSTSGDFEDQPRALASVVPLAERELLAEQVQALHEEGLEAIRSGSPAAASEVAAAYVALLMSWPRAWGRFGQRIDRGLLGARSHIGSSPVGEITRDLYHQAERSSAAGLREHVFSQMSIPWSTTSESLPLQATDLVIQMNDLVRGFAAAGRHSELADLWANKAWTYHAEICDYVIGPRLEDASASEEDFRYWVEMCGHFFASAVNLLRDFWERGQFDEFDEFVRRFRKLFEHVGHRGDVYRAQWTLQRRGSDPSSTSAAEVAEAERVIALHRALQYLASKRAGYELALLAWMLHQTRGNSGELRDRAIRYAASLPDADTLVASMEHALDGPLTRWLIFAGPSNEAGVIDTEGPLFEALALVLVMRDKPGQRIPPQSWMTQGRIDRLSSTVERVAGWNLGDVWRGDTERPTEDIAANISSSLNESLKAQEAIEEETLIGQELDPLKVQAYVESVVKGWAESRVIDGLAALAGSAVVLNDPINFGAYEFGFNPQLIPKGLFVSPSNWVGLDQNGQGVGRSLATSEVSEVVRLLADEGVEVAAVGSAVERLHRAIDELTEAGYRPSIVLMHFDWRLARELGLDPWEPDSLVDDAIARHVKGSIDGVPVVEWFDVADHHFYVVDLERFCHLEEARSPNADEPELPTTTVEFVDEATAESIIARWDLEPTPEAEAARRRGVLTSVRTHTYRRFRATLLDAAAARIVVVDEGEDRP
jgi:hypothetical protein